MESEKFSFPDGGADLLTNTDSINLHSKASIVFQNTERSADNRDSQPDTVARLLKEMQDPTPSKFEFAGPGQSDFG